jgi:hypothetical protein
MIFEGTYKVSKTINERVDGGKYSLLTLCVGKLSVKGNVSRLDGY